MIETPSKFVEELMRRDNEREYLKRIGVFG